MSTQTQAVTASNTAPASKRDQIRETLERRFRHHLRTGQLSPLLHLLMRYKLESQP
jgi:hypothetical protein